MNYSSIGFNKMRRKFFYVTIIAIVTIAAWIYWSTKTNLAAVMMFTSPSYDFRNKYLIHPNSTTCAYKQFILIIVTSYVGHVELRSAHRRAMPVDYLDRFNATRIFLLAKIPDREKLISQAAIQDESNTFGDILQGSFVENYRNLTLKHLMGLEWASTKCYQSTFILKVDDDTVFNLEETHNMLRREQNIDKNNFLMGYMLNYTRPKRQKQNKWYVTWDEYPRNHYPPYVSGWYYLTTPDVATKLCEEAVYHPRFWIDDILITGILTEAVNIKLRQLPKKFWLEYYELLECCLRDMITKFIRCDYVVGPNGGRHNLIYEFNKAFSDCGIWGNCTVRSDNKQALNNVCVAYRERTIFGNGQAQVEHIRL